MSLVSHNSLAALEKAVLLQRRRSSWASVIIAVLVLTLLLLILGFVLLPTLQRQQEVIIAYAPVKVAEEEINKKTVSQVLKKPTRPSSVQARVIAANVASPTAIPVPEVNVEEISMEFGSGDDFGEGWDSGDMGMGSGGGTTFFKQKVAAQRVAYVIDYSQSMKGERDKLMRAELAKSLGQLTPGMQFQMIFFCGPAWVAGGEVEVMKKEGEGKDQSGEGLVKMEGTTYKWRGRGPHEWRPSGKTQTAEWLALDSPTLEKAIESVRKTPLAWGTDWEPALEMAMEMDPAPQIIFFMTDGAVEGDMVRLGRSLGHRAKAKGIIVNTVAMMEPRAEDGMKELAESAGGQFSIVSKGGKVEVVPFK